ncbi:hypothetical protein [Nitrospira sp. BLG_2]|uniref:hypothetical protein n=1 Tax=Nitrospira sp. BLG_2 TaxID=3397507 RepID=UPI003B9ACBAA
MEHTENDADHRTRKWAVHRQDDNGNRFVVESGLSREDAERVIARYEERGHKQLYWIDADEE